MGSASNEAAGQRFIAEFESEVLGAFRPKSPDLAALVDGMWLAVLDASEEVAVFLRLQDGDRVVIAMFPDPIYHAEGDDDDLVQRLMGWTGQPEGAVRERLVKARLTWR